MIDPAPSPSKKERELWCGESAAHDAHHKLYGGSKLYTDLALREHTILCRGVTPWEAKVLSLVLDQSFDYASSGMHRDDARQIIEALPGLNLAIGLDNLRDALVHRADIYKVMADGLRGKTDTELAHNQFLRARMMRVAYFEAIKLVDELRNTGEVRDAAIGGSDGLIDLIRAEQRGE